MVSPKRLHRQPVVLLDTLPDHLGIVHNLARTERYQLTTVGLSRDSGPRFSRRCRHKVLPHWRWDRGPAQLSAAGLPPAGAVLFPVSLHATEWAIRHREELQERWQLVPLPEANDFHVANDKARLAEVARRAGLCVPPSADPSLPAARDWEHISYPALLKPRRGYGGSGIVQLGSPLDVSTVLAGLTSPANYLVQSLITGRDISCGVLCFRGELLAVVAYQPLARQGQFGRFTSLESIDDPNMLRVVAPLMRALHWHGIANIDLVRSHDGKIHVLEVNPRCWGNMAAGLAMGINFADLLCRAALGDDLAPQACSGGRFFGILDSLVLLRDAVTHRKVRRRLQWRRLLATESSLRFVASDPLPYLASVVQAGLARGGFALLRELCTRRAPTLPS